MAHYDLEEQEQLDSLKTWWKMYGNQVTGLVVAGSLAVIGWQGWSWYQNGQAAQASAVFASLEQGLAGADAARVKAAAGELSEKFSRTSYAALGMLLAAKQSFDSSDLKSAHLQLAWVVDNARNEVRDVARLRLASVAIDELAYDDALKVLADEPAPAFAARFLEIKGDVLVAQGKKDEARTAYKAALDKIAADKAARPGAGREFLQQKLDHLGEGV